MDAQESLRLDITVFEGMVAANPRNAAARASLADARENYLTELEAYAATFEGNRADLQAFFDLVGEPSERAKHDEDCWRKHVPCAIARVRAIVEE